MPSQTHKLIWHPVWQQHPQLWLRVTMGTWHGHDWCAKSTLKRGVVFLLGRKEHQEGTPQIPSPLKTGEVVLHLTHGSPEDSLPGGAGCYQCKVVVSACRYQAGVVQGHKSPLGKHFPWYLFSLSFVCHKIINRCLWEILSNGLLSLFCGCRSCLPG